MSFLMEIYNPVNSWEAVITKGFRKKKIFLSLEFLQMNGLYEVASHFIIDRSSPYKFLEKIKLISTADEVPSLADIMEEEELYVYMRNDGIEIKNY